MALLSIRNLHASIGDKEILKGVNLEINRGEVLIVILVTGTIPILGIHIDEHNVYCFCTVPSGRTRRAHRTDFFYA